MDKEQEDADENVEDGFYAETVEATVDEDATERTSLLSRAQQPDSTKLAIIRTAHSPILLSAILGLTIGLVKPLQRFITGVGVEGSSGGWLWLATGSALNAMGGSFPLFAILATGAAVRAGEQPPYVHPDVLLGRLDVKLKIDISLDRLNTRHLQPWVLCSYLAFGGTFAFLPSPFLSSRVSTRFPPQRFSCRIRSLQVTSTTMLL